MRVAFSPRPMSSSSRRSARRSRGFTMSEMLAAVAIIGLLATAATPAFVNMMRDHRITQACLQVADTFRECRTRSMSRGTAVLFRWKGDGAGKGTLVVKESVIGTGEVDTATGCLSTDWQDGSASSRNLYLYPFSDSRYELANFSVVSAAGAATEFVDICFDARRLVTFVRYDPADPFAELTGVPKMDVKNTKNQVQRTVFFPPNGVARMQL